MKVANFLSINYTRITLLHSFSWGCDITWSYANSEVFGDWKGRL